MQWRKALAAGAFAALPLFAQPLVRLPAPPIPKDTIRADSTVAPAAAEGDTTGDTVSYSATRIRFRGDHFSLSEKALLKYKGASLMADSIVYYSGDDIVEAMGEPMILDPVNPPISGYRMRYNLKNRVGTVYYGSSKRDNQNFHGTEIRREPDGDVYIARGEFSTCDKPEPHYFFYARRMIVEPNSKVLSGPVVMNIAEVPVAVLPMAVIPLGKGRRSGLLQPKIGGDQSQGFYMRNLGYYWAINDYMDFQTSGDLIEGAQGNFDNTDLNATYEWNKLYVWSGMLSGKAYVSQFDPSQAGGYLDFTNDLNLTPDGRQTLKGSGRIQSDPTIVSRNALTTEEALQQTANANLGYRRQFDWNSATLNIELTQNYNLTQNQVDRSLPKATFQVSGPLIPASEDETPGIEVPWYRQWTWRYGNLFNVDQVSNPSLNGARGDTNVYVGYSDNLNIGATYPAGYINLSPSLNLSQLWSASQTTGDTTRPYRNSFDPFDGRRGEYFFAWNTGVSANTNLYATAQAENRPWFGHISAVRHTVTPTVSLTYAPELDSNPAYYPNPKIGGVAYQAEQRTVGFGLGNSLDYKQVDSDSSKKKPDPHNFITTSNTLSYNFANHTQPWSTLSTRVDIYLTPSIPFSVNAVHELYDTYAATAQQNTLTSPILRHWDFTWRKGLELDGGFSTGTRLRDAQGAARNEFLQSPWSVSLNYNFRFDADRVGTTEGNVTERFFGTSEIYNVTKTHSATGGLHLNPTAEWKMSYDTEFNFTEGRFSSHVFGFERTLHCWRMKFNWTPVGVAEGWNFVISIIDLPDIKLQTSDSHGLRSNQ